MTLHGRPRKASWTQIQLEDPFTFCRIKGSWANILFSTQGVHTESSLHGPWQSISGISPQNAIGCPFTKIFRHEYDKLLL